MLLAYIIAGQVNQVNDIINKGFDIRDNPRLLESAVEEGHYNIVKLLL